VDVSEGLAEQLRLVRDATGRSLRELSRDVHVSSSSLSRYFSGQAVPPWQTVVALCRAAGRDPRPLREMWERARSGSRAESAPAPVRNDLPHDVTAFTGRREELAALLAAARSTRMVAVDGMGGVGKTALAVHAAHLLTPEFPGGQLYLDLHGFTPGREPVEPEEALRLLLAALGVTSARIPDGEPERAALWRAELATRRVIVVLDNAADADHVRELLPGAGQSLILITSRRRLVELDAVQPISLDVLPEDDAAELFAKAAGGDRDGDVGEVLRRCGNLPLAIRVAAARLRHRPSWTLDTLAERLHAGDLAVSGVFEMSLRQLDPAQRRMFGLLGLAPGSDIDSHAAAALADIPLGNARSLLEDLVDAHLVQEPTAGRYRMHDLLRQAARADGTVDDRTEAIARLADYYLSGLLAADKAMAHETATMSITVSLPPASVPAMDDVLGWLDAESDNIVATFWTAVELALDAQVVGLGLVAGVYFGRRGGLEQMGRLLDAALPAAGRLDDRRGLTWLHFVRGQVRLYGSRPAEAEREYEAARALMAEDRDVTGEVLVLGQLAELRMIDGDFRTAVELLREATRLLPDETGEYHLSTQARIGHALVRLGEYGEAHAIVSGVLDTARDRGDPMLERQCLDVLGPATLGLGDADTALELAQQAVALGRATGHRLFEASSLSDVAIALRHLGRLDEALDRHAEALRIVEEAGERQFVLQVLVPYAETCLAAGDRDAAVAHYRAAREGATALGLRHLATIAGDALARSTGVPSRPGTPPQHQSATL
jgi:tetratricopeptide (TPR) repeat protein/transcriptional regulator with XRE-family HTH domain